ncbi:MAG: translation initiation factor IF-2 [Candidatus Levyibacteriota bacterium]
MVKNKTKVASVSNFFPPVVAVLGHVDHGKTTLLDAIRKTNIAQREHGGITQKIGASSIEILGENQKRRITFIDTPGHEAFWAMRSRGALAADIGLLIVSATDGVMPQTKESIKLLQSAKIPFIVVLTKADLPEKNPEKVKNQLLKENVLLEGLGGDVPVIEVSAKKGKNVKELLELILLVSEVHLPNLKRAKEEAEKEAFSAIVIESKLDQRSGPRATIVVKKGKLKFRDELISEGIEARVKSIINDLGKNLESAIVGDAVEILGFEKVPNVGAVVSKKSEKLDQSPVSSGSHLAAALKEQEAIGDSSKVASLSIVLCADTLGSLEAIVASLPKGVYIISQKTGDIGPSDVLMAKESKAIIICFNLKVKPEITKLSKTEKVIIRNYSIIYELLDELKDVIEGKKEALIEEILGAAKILASFPYEKTKVLGIKVMDGRIARGDRIRLIRGEEKIGESTITSVRQGKEIVSKIEKGQEAGIIISPVLDFTIGDMLISHR